MIDNAKRGSIIDSAYGYKDAIEKYYFTKLMEEDFELDDTYIVSDGKLGGIDIPISGMKPISGTLTYENNELKNGCLTFDDYKVTYDGSKFKSEKGTCPTQNPTQRAVTHTDSNGVKYYNTEWIGANEVYYDPVNGVKCENYHEDNSKTGYNGLNGTGNQTSCLKWYAYSEQNGNVNLLLDHNTTANLTWINEDDYNKSYDALNGAKSLGITYPNGITGTDAYGSNGNWNKGPITLLNQLKTDTDGWSGISSRTDGYTNSNNYNSETIIDRYTISYSEYKARIITAKEFAYIVGNEYYDEKTMGNNNHYYFDSHKSSPSPTCKTDNTSGCLYGWLTDRIRIDCTSRGCLNNSDIATYGYWTVTSSALDSHTSWCVNSYGDVRADPHIPNGTANHGLRPVITVSKSSIFEC